MPALARAMELREEYARNISEARQILDAATVTDDDGNETTRALTSEEREQWDRFHEAAQGLRAEIDSIEEDAERQRQQEDSERFAGRSQGIRAGQPDADPEGDGGPSGPDEQEYNEAFVSWVRRGPTWMTDRQRQVLLRGYQVMTSEMRGSMSAEGRAQAVGSDVGGGFWMPSTFEDGIIEARKNFGGIRRAGATVRVTDTGEPLILGTLDDTSNAGRIVGENKPVTDTDLAAAQIVMNSYLYSSDEVKVSRQALEDTSFDWDGDIGRILGTRIGRILNTHFTQGDGAAKPEGLITGATVGVTGVTGQTVSVQPDQLIDLEHSVDIEYRYDGDTPIARYMFHDLTLREVKQLKDGDGQYMFAPADRRTGDPDMVNGWAFTVNNDMPQMAASAKSIAFGDFRAYRIRDVRGMVLLRLEERYADNFQVAFLAFSRHDGKLIDAGGNPVKVYQNSAS